MGALAKEKGLALVVKGDGLDSLAEIAEKAMGWSSRTSCSTRNA